VKLWEQQEGEDSAAYERFLSYLYCKPRSLARAYTAYLKEKQGEEAVKSRKKPQVPGNWQDNSRDHNWKERAVTYDIEQLSTVGASATTRFIDALDMYAALVLEGLVSGKIKPKDWQEATDALRTLGTYINADAIAALRDRRDSGDAT
jgi:hypothetical protein